MEIEYSHKVSGMPQRAYSVKREMSENLIRLTVAVCTEVVMLVDESQSLGNREGGAYLQR